MMEVKISWTEHSRVYTIPLEAFLKLAGISVSELKLKQTARYLLEQNEAKPIKE